MKTKLLLVLFALCGIAYAQELTDLEGDYLGQPLPGDIPQVFARGLVSTDHLEHSAPAFSPNGNQVFWSLSRRPDKGDPKVIMTMQRTAGKWSDPAIAPFSGKYIDDGPFYSADGKRLYFGSADPAKPAPGQGRTWDIYFVEKQANGWSERQSLGLLDRFPKLRSVSSPSVTHNGTLYFMGHTPGPMNDSGIYRAELVNGQYTQPQLLPPNINNPNGILTWTPFIAPDESYLLFSSNRRNPDRNYGDIWITRRNSDGIWSAPEMLPETINSGRQERFPMLSPDGKQLFFTRPTRGHSQDVYWVSAKVIEEQNDQARTIGPPKGTCILGGTGKEPEMRQRFVDLAGGTQARIVVVPSANGGQGKQSVQYFKDKGVAEVNVVHTRNPNMANTDTFIEPLTKATGVWFEGGRQWRLVDAYAGTKTLTAFRAVLDRGGVIAGGSAGATIQGSFLARGDTESNQIMMGDHQEGFGFVKNVAVDQHLLARNRQFDLIEIVQAHPELLGIGLDEGAAIVVQGNELEVIGKSYVLIYDYTKTIHGFGPFYFLQPGDRYDLKTRTPKQKRSNEAALKKLVDKPWPQYHRSDR